MATLDPAGGRASLIAVACVILDAMDLPLRLPVEPMLAKSALDLPGADGWLFEPKWDGFRCIVLRVGDEVELSSRGTRPFTRYFPELLAPLRQQLPARCAVDGELVVVAGDRLDFDALQQRIHPAASRVRMLAGTTPARFVAFDLLAVGDEDLTSVPFAVRRRRLEQLWAHAQPPLHLTPLTSDVATARDWFTRFEGAGLDGVVAKAAAGRYEPGRRGWVKVKHQRTADMAVAGFRWHKDGVGVGSLLLGLYGDDDRLNHVGVASSFTAAQRRALVDELAPYRSDALDDHPWRDWADLEAHAEGTRLPGAVSRWSGGRDLSWEPLRVERAAEVAFNQLTAGRLRHPAKFLRWRDDRDPASCRYDQLEVVPPAELAAVFGA
ncbi:MAG TPA: ATP-dependent DNA ligase [Egibacteraceae bacterium]|nr:ATP-dependent DNA ligase [Egibacteraceae bacterium]